MIYIFITVASIIWIAHTLATAKPITMKLEALLAIDHIGTLTIYYGYCLFKYNDEKFIINLN